MGDIVTGSCYRESVLCYGVNRVGDDGNNIHYSGNSMIVDPMGEIIVPGIRGGRYFHLRIAYRKTGRDSFKISILERCRFISDFQIEKMTRGAVIDVESLLLPIDAEDPAGADLKHYESLEKIRLGLRSDRESGQQPEYKKVIKLATTVLTEKSKDLRVAVGLAEALAGAFQFAGLSEGFRVSSWIAGPVLGWFVSASG